MCDETKNQSRRHSSSQPEPADPYNPDHGARRKLPLIPDSVKVDALPDPLRDGDRSLTLEEARKTYLKVVKSNMKKSGRTSKHDHHKRHYWRILETDRRLQGDYESLTTAMLTRRLSPLTEDREWLTLWECDQMLNGGSIRRSVHSALKYQLDGFEFEWVAVTSPTTSAGIPHEHIYIWIEDPDDEITTGHIKPALDKHLKHCTNAYEKDHQVQTDGSDGAITYRHNLETKDAGHTVGAGYVARQLAHLPITDFYNSAKDDPPDAVLEGAALAWASNFDWFRSSRGV